jgi:hypothetical protein
MKVKHIKYLHRKLNGWEYRAAVATVIDEGEIKEAVFGISNDSAGERTGLEIYQGENYIVESKSRSRSWRYDPDRVPKKWQDLYSKLEAMHGIIDWSRDVSRITSALVDIN